MAICIQNNLYTPLITLNKIKTLFINSFQALDDEMRRLNKCTLLYEIDKRVRMFSFFWWCRGEHSDTEIDIYCCVPEERRYDPVKAHPHLLANTCFKSDGLVGVVTEGRLSAFSLDVSCNAAINLSLSLSPRAERCAESKESTDCSPIYGQISHKTHQK